MTVVLGTDTLAANLAGDADPCAQHVFVCAVDTTSTKSGCI